MDGVGECLDSACVYGRPDRLIELLALEVYNYASVSPLPWPCSPRLQFTEFFREWTRNIFQLNRISPLTKFDDSPRSYHEAEHLRLGPVGRLPGRRSRSRDQLPDRLDVSIQERIRNEKEREERQRKQTGPTTFLDDFPANTGPPSAPTPATPASRPQPRPLPSSANGPTTTPS